MTINFKSLISKFKKLKALLRDRGLFGAYNFLYDLYFLKNYPCSIKIEITTRCNLSCIMCPHGYSNFGLWEGANKDMSFEKFKTIIDNFHGLKLIDFAGTGENFLNKDFMKMVRYAKSKNILVDFFSNFCLVDENISKELIEIGINKIYLSIDGATKETYEKIRVGSDFEKVINNVKNFFRLKKEQNKQFPYIVFNYVVNKYNFNEIIDFVELVSSLAEGQKTLIIFKNMFPLLFSGFLEKEFKNIILPQKIINEVKRRSEELNISVGWENNMFRGKPLIDKCNYYLRPFISIDGEVYFCCVSRSLRSSQKKMILGNIFEYNFKEIWQSKEYKNFRKLLHRGKTPFCCKNCYYYDTDKD